MLKFIYTLFDRLTEPNGRGQRIRAGLSLGLCSAASLWAVLLFAMSRNNAALLAFGGPEFAGHAPWFAIVLGVGSGLGSYMAMAWWQTRGTAVHAAVLGISSVALATCVAVVVGFMGFKVIDIVAGAWSIQLFSIAFAKGLPRHLPPAKSTTGRESTLRRDIQVTKDDCEFLRQMGLSLTGAVLCLVYFFWSIGHHEKQDAIVETTAPAGYLVGIQIKGKSNLVGLGTVVVTTTVGVYEATGHLVALTGAQMHEETRASGKRYLCVSDRSVCMQVRKQLPVE